MVRVRVLRNGSDVPVPIAEVVVGDVVHLETGDKVMVAGGAARVMRAVVFVWLRGCTNCACLDYPPKRAGNSLLSKRGMWRGHAAVAASWGASRLSFMPLCCKCAWLCVSRGTMR